MRTRANPTRLLTALALVAIALAGAGCSGDDDPTAPVTETHFRTASDGDLQITVATDRASYEFGEDVTITVTVDNTGSSALDIAYQDRSSGLFANVISEDDYSHYAGGEARGDRLTLEAGASISSTFTWRQTIRPSLQPSDRGFYEVMGRIFLEDRATLRARGLYIQLK